MDNISSKVEPSMWAKRFSFDRCFGEEGSGSGEGQEEVGGNSTGVIIV